MIFLLWSISFCFTSRDLCLRNEVAKDHNLYVGQ
jgi:hypothetical protein